MSTAEPRTPAHDAGSGPVKMAVLVAQDIVNGIVNQSLTVGGHLPVEQEMLDHYQVARGTLREALRILEHHGAIQVRTGPGGGPIVQEPGPEDLARTFALLLQIKRLPIQSVLELRSIAEPMLAAMAATRRSEGDLEVLRQNLAQMQRHLADDRMFLRANLDFHEAIANASGNGLFAVIVEALDHVLAGQFRVRYQPQARSAVLSAHAEILTSLEVQDAEATQIAMASHIADMQSYMDARFPHLLEAPVMWEHAGRQ